MSHTDFNGHTTMFEYDAMNRLTRKTPDIALQEPPVIFTYTATGQRSTMIDDVDTTTYSYDLRDRLQTKATPIGTLTYDYDFNGNVTKIQSSTANGTLVTYQYDALNRVVNVIDARLSGNQTTRYGYDAVGDLLTNISPNAVTNLYRYDSLNRLTNLTAKVGATTLGSFAYLVGTAGNRTNLSETVNGTSRAYAWTYDALYRLTNEVISASSAGTISYKYDSVGNRTNRTSSVTGISGGDSSYNANDQLGTDLYDSNGNTTNSAGNPYRYDFENHLTNFKNRGAVYVYDGDGNRASKEVGATTTLYLVDTRNPSGYAQVLEELTVTGGTMNLSRAYTFGLSLISQRVSDGTVRFYGYDGHGSTRFLTATNAVVTDVYAYDAYGSMIASNVATANVYLYCGEQLDPILGQYYFRQRTYNPGTGRFPTRDTYEGDQFDPLSLHKYLYARNDPVNRIDPSGKLAIVSNLIWGNRVHDLIGADFVSQDPANHFYDRTVAFLTGSPNVNIFPFNLRPDLTDVGSGEVYEIKPLPYGFFVGRAQLSLYLGFLNALGPGTHWQAGSSYIPPSALDLDSGLVWAIVYPPLNGVVLYALVDSPTDILATLGIVGFLGTVESADIEIGTAVAIQNFSLGGL